MKKVWEIKQKVPHQSEVIAFNELSNGKPSGPHPSFDADGKPIWPRTLENIERARKERDRAGLIFSNVLRQVRGRIQQNDMSMAEHYGQPRSANQGRDRAETSFFETFTDKINYKSILGFDKRRDEEEEVL